MKYLICLIIASVACNVSSWGQSTGFYGKRKFIEFSGSGNWALLNKLINSENYYSRSASGKSLVKDDPNFNYGLSGTIGIASKRNVGVSLSTSLNFYKTPAPTYIYYDQSGSSDSYSVSVNHEHLNLRTFSVMPTLIIFGGNSGSPSGTAHEIGVGFNQTKVVEKDYLYNSNYEVYDSNTGQYVNGKTFLDSIYPNNSYINFKEKAKGVTIMYAFKIRTPLSKSLLLTYGLKYTLNFSGTGNSMTYYNESGSSYLNARTRNLSNILISSKRTQIRTLISLNIGLTYVF